MKYKFIPHTADIKFQCFGKNLEETFENAFLALKHIIVGNIKIKNNEKKKIFIKGKDLEALLNSFLEEFLFLLDSNGFLLNKIEKIEINEKNNKYTLKAFVFGDSVSDYKISNQVKAITYNEMFVKKNKERWICQVVLDV
jgi:SHS2 domain-containing protein